MIIQCVDYSEPFFYITFALGFVGIIYNVIQTENFDIVIACLMTFGSGIAIWRVKKLGLAKELNDSINQFDLENQELNQANNEYRELNRKLCKENEVFDSLLKTMELRGRDINDVKNDLVVLVEKYRLENERQEKNNKLALFYTIDVNRDGKLEGDEINEMRQILKSEYGIDDLYDLDGNGKISRKELINQLFIKKE